MIARRRRRNDSVTETLLDSSSSSYRSPSQSGNATLSSNSNGKSPIPANLLGTEMTCQDRTNEFLSTVKSMQGRQLVSFNLPIKEKLAHHILVLVPFREMELYQ